MFFNYNMYKFISEFPLVNRCFNTWFVLTELKAYFEVRKSLSYFSEMKLCVKSRLLGKFEREARLSSGLVCALLGVPA